jgi:regulator of replication initiation timing
MSFDEQPDPLSDCMEAYDKLKKVCLEQQSRADTLAAELSDLKEKYSDYHEVNLANGELSMENAELRERLTRLENAVVNPSRRPGLDTGGAK